MMFRILLLVFVWVFLTDAVLAQTNQPRRCLRLVNETSETVYGLITTAPQDENTPPQRMNIKLTPEGDHKVLRVCSAGPFYEGGRLRLVLRTIVPVFECKTVAAGDVVVERVPDETGAGTKLSARCR